MGTARRWQLTTSQCALRPLCFLTPSLKASFCAAATAYDSISPTKVSVFWPLGNRRSCCRLLFPSCPLAREAARAPLENQAGRSGRKPRNGMRRDTGELRCFSGKCEREFDRELGALCGASSTLRCWESLVRHLPPRHQNLTWERRAEWSPNPTRSVKCSWASFGPRFCSLCDIEAAGLTSVSKLFQLP